MKPGKLFIFSGPSQVGKDTIVRELCQDPTLKLAHVITNTTRPQRPGERQGVTYHFMSEAPFLALAKSGELLEWARVRQALFGTPRRPVSEALARGQNVILQIDVQGALQIKAKLPASVLVFITAESTAEIRRRIFSSTRMSEAQKIDRWREAQRELKAKSRYQYVLVNRLGYLPATLRQAKTIIRRELATTTLKPLTNKGKSSTLRKRL